jgi:hypothetical protein
VAARKRPKSRPYQVVSYRPYQVVSYRPRTSTEIDEFVEKFEEEFSLVAFLSSSSFVECEDIGAWIVDSGSSRHMTGMRLMFLSVSVMG